MEDGSDQFFPPKIGQRNTKILKRLAFSCFVVSICYTWNVSVVVVCCDWKLKEERADARRDETTMNY